MICVELSSDDMLIDILRWALAVQDVALTNTMLDPVNRSSLHVINLKTLLYIFYHLFIQYPTCFSVGGSDQYSGSCRPRNERHPTSRIQCKDCG